MCQWLSRLSLGGPWPSSNTWLLSIRLIGCPLIPPGSPCLEWGNPWIPLHSAIGRRWSWSLKICWQVVNTLTAAIFCHTFSPVGKKAELLRHVSNPGWFVRSTIWWASVFFPTSSSVINVLAAGGSHTCASCPKNKGGGRKVDRKLEEKI